MTLRELYDWTKSWAERVKYPIVHVEFHGHQPVYIRIQAAAFGHRSPIHRLRPTDPRATATLGSEVPHSGNMKRMTPPAGVSTTTSTPPALISTHTHIHPRLSTRSSHSLSYMTWLDTLTSTPVLIAGALGITAAVYAKRNPTVPTARQMSEQAKEVAQATQAEGTQAKVAQAVSAICI